MRRAGGLVGLAMMVLVGLTVGCSRPAESAATDWQAEGPIELMDDNTWVVDTHLVRVAPNALVVGTPTVGAIVKVIGTRGQTGSPIVHRVETVRAAEPTALSPPPVVQPEPKPPAPAVQPEPKPAAPPAAKPATKPVAPPSKAKPRDEDDDD